MKSDSLEKLFGAAAKSATPRPDADFADDVLRAVRRESRMAPATLTEDIGALFPRVAFAAALVIGVCCVTDVALDSLSGTSLSAGVTQLSEQWLFAVN